MSDVRLVQYVPPGPVAAAFIMDPSHISAIMGPEGGGKSSGVVWKILTWSKTMPVSPLDGKRHARWACIRESYRDLDRTAIKTWCDWVPRSLGEFKGAGGGDPPQHKLDIPLADGTVLELEMLFVGIGDNRIEDVMRGWELTGVWIMEADLMAPEVMMYAMGRVGRFPSVRHGGCPVPKARGEGAMAGFIVLDYNAPDIDNYLYKLFEEEDKALLGEDTDLAAVFSARLFKQPGGLDERAENIKNLPGGRAYYAGRIAALRKQGGDWLVRRLIHNQYGPNRAGTPVYPEYEDARHFSTVPLEPIKGRKIVIGADAGRTPAAIFSQQDDEGQIRVYDELIEVNCSARRFGEALRRRLTERFGDHADAEIVADPSSQYASDADDRSWLELVSEAADLPVLPAYTNALNERLEAVRVVLADTIRAGKPRYILDPGCRDLRRGFVSDYRWRKVTTQGGSRTDFTAPEKNAASHPHDANQYAVLHHLGFSGVRDTGRLPSPHRRISMASGGHRETASDHPFDVLERSL